MKVCVGPCGTSKPLTEFRSNPRATDGHHSLCRACEALGAAERRRRAKGEIPPPPPPPPPCRDLRVLLTARLLAEGGTPEHIREAVGELVGRRPAPRVLGGLIGDAREAIARWQVMDRASRIEDSLADYRAIDADPDCPARDRVRARECIDSLLKQQRQRAEADTPSEVGIGVDWSGYAAVVERLPGLRSRWGLSPLGADLSDDLVGAAEVVGRLAANLEPEEAEAPTLDDVVADSSLQDHIVSTATYRYVIEDPDSRHGDKVQARRALDRLCELRESRGGVPSSAAASRAEKRAQAAARVVRRAHQSTVAEMLDRDGELSPEMESELAAEVCDVIRMSPWIPQEPFAAQVMFLIDRRRAAVDPDMPGDVRPQEVLYGGAAGPGKSSAMLMAALLFADVPDYSALLLRRRFPDLAQPGGLMDRCIGWMNSPAAVAAGGRWKAADYIATFPGGAKVKFGFIDRAEDQYKYQGGEYQLVGWDELTQFQERPYRYLFSRLRRTEDNPCPLRMRSASNPGGEGHEWVRARFVDGGKFIAARLDDNPHLSTEEYVASLGELDEVTRQQLLAGDWTARAAGAMFRREMFPIIDALPTDRWYSRPVRYWDLGSTEGDGDWTVGTLVTRSDRGDLYVMDVRDGKLHPADVERLIAQTHEMDGREVRVRIPCDRGQAGRSQGEHFRRTVVPLADFDVLLETGSKWVRAKPVGALAAQGRVYLVRGAWMARWFDQLEAFAEDPKAYQHDDHVDSLAGAFQVLIEEPTAPWRPLFSGTDERPKVPPGFEAGGDTRRPRAARDLKGRLYGR